MPKKGTSKRVPSLRDWKAHVRMELLHNFEPFIKIREQIEPQLQSEPENERAICEAIEDDWKVQITAWDRANFPLEKIAESTGERFSLLEALEKPKDRKDPDVVVLYLDRMYEGPFLVKGPAGLIQREDSESLVLPLAMSKSEAEEILSKYHFTGGSNYKRFGEKELEEAKQVFCLMQEPDASATKVVRKLHLGIEPNALESKRVTYRNLYKEIVNDIISPPGEFRI